MKHSLKPAVFLILFLILPLCSLAGLDDNIIQNNEWAGDITIYHFTNSYPQISEVNKNGLSELPAENFLPWTLKRRVSGFALTGQGLVVGVNAGYPMLLELNDDSNPVFISPSQAAAAEFPDEDSGMTAEIAYCSPSEVVFHYYRDQLFSGGGTEVSAPYTSDAEGAVGTDPALLGVSVSAGSISAAERLSLGFSMNKTGWEPVEMIRRGEDTLVAWKYTDEKKTRFRYLRHNSDGEPYSEINEKYFRDEYPLQSIENGSFEFRGFIRAVRTGAAGNGLSSAGDVYLEMTTALPGEDYPLFYYSEAPAGKNSALPVQLPACVDERKLYVLVDDEVLLCSADITRLRLPELPDGFRYRYLWVSGSSMLISWEESRFPYTGRAGMMYIKMRDIFNGKS